MRRTVSLIALAATLLCSAVASGAVKTAPPRGVLTKVEYQELYASFEAMKHVGRTHGTPTYVARHTCRALTNATALTAAEHAECEASLFYSFDFYAFPYAIQHCAKAATAASRARCSLHAINAFQKAVRAFIRTNAASTKAATPRHLSNKCLEYLLFTRPQAQTTQALSLGLKRYARAIRSGNAGRITNTGNRLNADFVSSRQAMSFNISVSVCRHQ